MKTIFKFLAAALVLLGTSSAFAQECVPAPYQRGQQQRCWDGRPIGTVFVPAHVTSTPANVIRVPSGSPIPQGYCSWGGRVENVAVGAVIGGLIGLLAGDNHRAAGKGAAAGATAGLFIPCQQEAQRQPVQYVPVAQQEVRRVQQQGNNCPAGTSWRKLDWEGHPKNGLEACLPSDEVIAQQKAKVNNDRCKGFPGTSWKKLDWPGHHQHGMEACLPSDEVIAQQKAVAG